MAILSATASITGSVANDGMSSTVTADPYWVNDATVTFDNGNGSASIDFDLPDGDLLQISILTAPGAETVSAGNPVVPGNWGALINTTAITGEGVASPAGNLYMFEGRSLEVTVIPEPSALVLFASLLAIGYSNNRVRRTFSR